MLETNEKTGSILHHQMLEAGIYYQAEKDLGTFFRRSWKILEPTTELLTNWHQDLIAEYLMACYKRQIKRLIINMPPRYAKSNEVTVCFPAWVWTQDPSHRFITGSYADNLATKHSIDRRTLIESDWYRRGYGERFNLSSDQNVKSEFTNDKRGSMYATGLSGAVTGKGCNILIIDDPHDAQKVHSDAVRKNDILSFDQKFSTRLDDKKNDVIIVVMQRLHEQDLTGHLIDQGGWEHLTLSGIAEKETLITFPTSGRQILREKDSFLHEEREGEFEMEQNKKTLGSKGFAAQIQQAPTPDGGVLIDPAWFRFYKELPPRFNQVIQSWDMTFKDTKQSDYVVGQVWGRLAGAAYLFPFRIRKQLDFVKTIEAFKTLTLRYPEASLKIVEDKANGPAVISALRSKIPGIVPYSPKDSKEGRVSAVSPMIEAGMVFLPDPSIAPWITDFLIEVAKFPNGPHDDECFVAGTKIKTLFGEKNIEDIKTGEFVITPMGLAKVTDSKKTSYAETINRVGLEGTPSHKIITNKGLVPLDRVSQDMLVKFSWITLILFYVREAVVSKESNLSAYQIRQNIISLCPKQMKVEDELSDFTSLFTKLSIKKKFLLGFTFITRTATRLITLLIILSVYHLSNIVRLSILGVKKFLPTLIGLDPLQRLGTLQMSDAYGTQNTLKKLQRIENVTSYFARCVRTNLNQLSEPHFFADTIVPSNGITGTRKKAVYNLTTSHGVYFANGILVSNCDAMSQALLRFFESMRYDLEAMTQI